MTVWVIHPPARRDGAIADIQPAAKWGEIRLIHRLTQYVTEDDIVGDGLSDQHMQRLIAASQEFNPMTDYLVMAGDQLQMQQFGLLLAQRYPKGYWVLRWNIKDRDYYAVRMVPATVPVTLTRRGPSDKVTTTTSRISEDV